MMKTSALLSSERLSGHSSYRRFSHRVPRALKTLLATLSAAIVLAPALAWAGQDDAGVAPAGAGSTASIAKNTGYAMGAQYDTTHVYVPGDQMDAFVDSFTATLGGKASQRAVFTVTPTPSKTASQYVQTPAGMISVFGFQTPVPWPFGQEKYGYLVSDMDKALAAARAAGADVLVTSFDDPIGRDALIQWPGGLTMQLYWHTKAPSYAPLETIPDARVYVSQERAKQFVRSWLRFSHGKVVSDNHHADGALIGRQGDRVQRIRITSPYGAMVVFVTDGKLPFPFGYDVTGYRVADLEKTLAVAQQHGVKIVSPLYQGDEGRTAVVQFPGGYIAEMHDAVQ